MDIYNKRYKGRTNQGTPGKNHHQSDGPANPRIKRKDKKQIGQDRSLNQGYTPSVPRRNEIWIWGDDNDSQVISEEINRNGRRLDVHNTTKTET